MLPIRHEKLKCPVAVARNIGPLLLFMQYRSLWYPNIASQVLTSFQTSSRVDICNAYDLDRSNSVSMDEFQHGLQRMHYL
ncbi:unnamed protein product [Amoebophrya sp. A120]|nr:unnamed protein product [Amoebophrya sp. A120]|eukprot:GSA120T00022402001.1